MGEQAQYALTVAHEDGRQEWRGRIGFRTVELDTTPDQVGTAFRLSVNGLLADRAAPDAEVDDMLVTLLPGRTAVFSVHAAAAPDADLFTGPPVLRSANDLHGVRVQSR